MTSTSDTCVPLKKTEVDGLNDMRFALALIWKIVNSTEEGVGFDSSTERRLVLGSDGELMNMVLEASTLSSKVNAKRGPMRLH